LKASLIAALAIVLVLGGCNDRDTANALPPPLALNADAMGVFCGMNLIEHPGPKGQIITESRIDPYWFSSARDAIAFTLMPDQPRDIRAVYVSDMSRAPSWELPGERNWIDARTAYFVIESRKQGGMGAAEAVPFGDHIAAEQFAAQNGGRVARLNEIPASYVLGSDASSADEQSAASAARPN
jgi:copper chaperone NosL